MAFYTFDWVAQSLKQGREVNKWDKQKEVNHDLDMGLSYERQMKEGRLCVEATICEGSRQDFSSREITWMGVKGFTYMS